MISFPEHFDFFLSHSIVIVVRNQRTRDAVPLAHPHPHPHSLFLQEKNAEEKEERAEEEEEEEQEQDQEQEQEQELHHPAASTFITCSRLVE